MTHNVASDPMALAMALPGDIHTRWLSYESHMAERLGQIAWARVASLAQLSFYTGACAATTAQQPVSPAQIYAGMADAMLNTHHP